MTTNKAIRIINHAADLIEKKGWTRGAAARRSNGEEVPAGSPKACRFCMLGAMSRATDELKVDWQALDTATDLIRHALGSTSKVNNTSIIRFNDETASSKKEVIRLMRKVVEDAA